MYLQTAMVRCEVEAKLLKGSWTSGKVSVPRKEALFSFLLGKTSAILPCYSGFWNVVVQMTYGSLVSILLLTFFCSTPPSPTVSTDLFSSSLNTELHLRINTKLYLTKVFATQHFSRTIYQVLAGIFHFNFTSNSWNALIQTYFMFTIEHSNMFYKILSSNI